MTEDEKSSGIIVQGLLSELVTVIPVLRAASVRVYAFSPVYADIRHASIWLLEPSEVAKADREILAKLFPIEWENNKPLTGVQLVFQSPRQLYEELHKRLVQYCDNKLIPTLPAWTTADVKFLHKAASLYGVELEKTSQYFLYREVPEVAVLNVPVCYKNERYNCYFSKRFNEDGTKSLFEFDSDSLGRRKDTPVWRETLVDAVQDASREICASILQLARLDSPEVNQ